MLGFRTSSRRRLAPALLGAATALALSIGAAPAAAKSACQPITSPTSGIPGTLVTLSGCDFTDATAVQISDGPVSEEGAILFGSDINPGPTSLTFIAPDLPAGRYDVFVQKADGITEAFGPLDDFTYLVEPNRPTISGLTPRVGLAWVGGLTTISGAKLSGTKSVTFDGVKAPSFIVLNSRTILVVTPRLPRGDYGVKVTTEFGTSALTNNTFYTYR